jgi:hypothetical protein
MSNFALAKNPVPVSFTFQAEWRIKPANGKNCRFGLRLFKHGAVNPMMCQRIMRLKRALVVL